MTKDKLSYKLIKILKSTLAAIAVPVFFIYVMISKPDYTIMNGLAHVVLPVANFVGDVVTWPIHVVGNSITWVRETSQIRAENKRLREKLDTLLSQKYEYEVALAENKRLEQELDVKKSSPYSTVVADIQFNDSVFHHTTFLINRGTQSGLERGMVVVSFDNRMVGMISDCGSQFCRVRALSDSDSNVAIRIAGADVSGFLQGNGKTGASVGFFSDTQFSGRQGLKVITSNISGILPSGIYVGDMIDETRVDVLSPNKISRVLVLKFDNNGSYK
ncbi:MAG: rod shape-determining protein MreC [Alphaproteobacteria bacterium]|nr:rod shape-determining protein MreC [Alphaproteobacteria bacterium]